jgi:hypothetical protein
MYPGCTWADQPITTSGTSLGFIGMAATVDPCTGLTTRYRIHAYDPTACTVLIALDVEEGPAGVMRSVSGDRRNQPFTASLSGLDEVRLVHRRSRHDVTALHTDSCRHVIKAAFTAGGDKGVPRDRRVYRFRMETTESSTYRFLVHAPSQQQAHHLAQRWWQGSPSTDGYTGSRLSDGERIELLMCDGARDMVWPYPERVADPV